MQNKLINLNDHLFAQIERLADDELMSKSGDAELKRGKVLKSLSSEVIKLHVVALQAEKFKQSGAFEPNTLPETFQLTEKKS